MDVCIYGQVWGVCLFFLGGAGGWKLSAELYPQSQLFGFVIPITVFGGPQPCDKHSRSNNSRLPQPTFLFLAGSHVAQASPKLSM